jgi:hypothetical protein
MSLISELVSVSFWFSSAKIGSYPPIVLTSLGGSVIEEPAWTGQGISIPLALPNRRVVSLCV